MSHITAIHYYISLCFDCLTVNCAPGIHFSQVYLISTFQSFNLLTNQHLDVAQLHKLHSNSQLSAKCNFEANPRTCGPLVSLESENNLDPVRYILWGGIIGCAFVAHISKIHVSNLLNLQFWQQIMFSNGNESSIASQYPIATSRYPVGTSKYPIATSNYIAATSKQHPVAAKISVVTIAGCLLLTEGSLLQRD